MYVEGGWGGAQSQRQEGWMGVGRGEGVNLWSWTREDSGEKPQWDLNAEDANLMANCVENSEPRAVKRLQGEPALAPHPRLLTGSSA